MTPVGLAEHDHIVALSTGLLSNHQNCNRAINICTKQGTCVQAKIVDECDESGGCRPGNIDGTVGLWSALGLNTDLGVVQVQYTIV
ncbi:hypothetical protein HDV03_005442 [Kappamyces sp. JEL0829]|nr:hypothetical protein HDV03_005442 [Kappamyces sp. JEL0829]